MYFINTIRVKTTNYQVNSRKSTGSFQFEVLPVSVGALWRGVMPFLMHVLIDLFHDSK